MSNFMYQGSTQVFSHNLKNLSAILKVAAANAGVGHFVLDHGHIEFNLQEVAVHPDNFTDVFAHNILPLSQ